MAQVLTAEFGLACSMIPSTTFARLRSAGLLMAISMGLLDPVLGCGACQQGPSPVAGHEQHCAYWGDCMVAIMPHHLGGMPSPEYRTATTS